MKNVEVRKIKHNEDSPSSTNGVKLRSNSKQILVPSVVSLHREVPSFKMFLVVSWFMRPKNNTSLSTLAGEENISHSGWVQNKFFFPFNLYP